MRPKDHIYFIILLLLPCCIFDSDHDAGSYSISVREYEIYTQQGGRGIFVLGIEPGGDFEGDVDVSVCTYTYLNCHYNYTLTPEKPVCEIMIKPEYFIEAKEYPVIVHFKHGDKTKKISLKVIVQKNREPFDGGSTYLDIFLGWAEKKYPELPVDINQGWSGFFANNSSLDGGSGKMIYLCDDWELSVELMSYPPFTTTYSLRKRSEYDIKMVVNETHEIFQVVKMYYL